MAEETLKFTDEMRKNVLMLSSYGMPGQKIADLIGVKAKSTVNNIIRIAKMVENDEVEEARKIAVSCHADAHFAWACKKYGKKIPEPPKPEPPKAMYKIQQAVEAAEIKRIVNDAIKENVKDAKIETIDKDQMSRIMYALGKLDERIESIEQTLEVMRKEQNANADALYKLVTNFNNSVLMEMRKRR